MATGTTFQRARVQAILAAAAIVGGITVGRMSAAQDQPLPPTAQPIPQPTAPQVAPVPQPLPRPGEDTNTQRQPQPEQQPKQQEQAPQPALSQAELDTLVAPIALYPDSLLSQVLMASTYPLEIVQASRFLDANPNLNGDPLADALAQQRWDPSVKSLTNFPTVLQMLSDKLDQTVQLGNAFLAQQQDVMESVQRLRRQAEVVGNLQTNQQQRVEYVPVDNAPASTPQYIIIDDTDQDASYVPVYDPYVTFGTWRYADRRPYFWTPRDYVPTRGIWWGQRCAYGPGWGYAWGRPDWRRHDIDIDVRRHDRIPIREDRSEIIRRERDLHDGRGAWQHDPQHRDGIVYGNGRVAERYGGRASSDVARDREQTRGRETTPSAKPVQHDNRTDNRAENRDSRNDADRSDAKRKDGSRGDPDRNDGRAGVSRENIRDIDKQKSDPAPRPQQNAQPTPRAEQREPADRSKERPQRSATPQAQPDAKPQRKPAAEPEPKAGPKSEQKVVPPQRRPDAKPEPRPTPPPPPAAKPAPTPAPAPAPRPEPAPRPAPAPAPKPPPAPAPNPAPAAAPRLDRPANPHTTPPKGSGVHGRGGDPA